MITSLQEKRGSLINDSLMPATTEDMLHLVFNPNVTTMTAQSSGELSSRETGLSGSSAPLSSSSLAMYFPFGILVLSFFGCNLVYI